LQFVASGLPMDLGGQLKSTAIFSKRENSAESAISTDKYRSPVHLERSKPRVRATRRSRGENLDRADSLAEGVAVI
jgi:hypothetical protein